MPNTPRDGFTIVELIIAVFILSVGIIGLAGSMMHAGTIQRLGLSRVEMTSLAESKIEDLHSKAVSQTDTLHITLGGSLTSSTTDHWDQVTSAAGRSYRRRWVVTTGPAGSRDVTLRIEPLSLGRGEVSSLDFSTLLFKGE